tara:strand:+ start:1328 stop:1861 length:534 start_codon:yes stop_codon:yes gene_type:complete
MAGEMVWIDLEMTGLDIERESIIEIATVITDGELNIIAMGPNLAIKVDDELLASMDEWNTTHHTSSGLVDRVRNEGVSLEDASEQTCKFIRENIEGFTPPLCGNSVHNDRAFLAKEMPNVLEMLHYRLVDVSTIKELSNRWYPDNPRYVKKEAHRALDDIIESIEELRHYRSTLFRD